MLKGPLKEFQMEFPKIPRRRETAGKDPQTRKEQSKTREGSRDIQGKQQVETIDQLIWDNKHPQEPIRSIMRGPQSRPA